MESALCLGMTDTANTTNMYPKDTAVERVKRWEEDLKIEISTLINGDSKELDAEYVAKLRKLEKPFEILDASVKYAKAKNDRTSGIKVFILRIGDSLIMGIAQKQVIPGSDRELYQPSLCVTEFKKRTQEPGRGHVDVYPATNSSGSPNFHKAIINAINRAAKVDKLEKQAGVIEKQKKLQEEELKGLDIPDKMVVAKTDNNEYLIHMVEVRASAAKLRAICDILKNDS